MEKQWIKTSSKKQEGYPLWIGQDLTEKIIQREITESQETTGWVLVTDQNIQRIYQQKIQDLEAGAKNKSLPFLTLVIPPGESSKSLQKVEELAGVIAGKDFGRKTKILALGGGVVGDLAGFLASIYMRGVEYVQIPTTLLAQVDSSIGGKTGVNLFEGKNLLGSFYPPCSVWIDEDFLTTLEIKDWVNGYGELLKHGVLKDEGLFKAIEDQLDQNRTFNRISEAPAELTAIILRGITVKKEIIEADEKEQGLRKLLNYGHTFGHALEALYQYEGCSHGEAVLKGMVYEAEIAVCLGLLNNEDFSRIRNLIDGILKRGRDLPSPTKNIEDLIGFMKRDKKNRGNEISFILPEKIGKTREVFLKEEDLRRIFFKRKF